MTYRCEALVLGIGNILWADEGFGVRAVEALHATYAFPQAVSLLDGGTQGVYLFDAIASARRVLVLDAIDFGLPPGALKVLRDGEVSACTPIKISPHQTGFNDVLALAQLQGRVPAAVTVVGVQLEEISDLGGSLRDAVKARIPEAVEIAALELARWGYPGQRRAPGEAFCPLNAVALTLDVYESGRPSEAAAYRNGDPRVLARARFAQEH